MYHRCMTMIHQKCRQEFYPRTNVKRFEVPINKISWDVQYPEYNPNKYTSSSIKNKPWADPEIESNSFIPKWNAIDGSINRKSFMGDYIISKNGYPLNPVGRTGIIGRGVLGRWGPNHAADPIVTRWKRNNDGVLEIDKNTKKQVIQFVAIQRRDCMEWAIPGGMVDPGETVSATLKREFMEEAMNLLESDTIKRNEMEISINKFFQNGTEIYKGYVDDPRNTDNAWIETIAFNFHDEDNSILGQLTLTAGDDASNVRWMDASAKLNLYASHVEFIRETVHKHNAHW